MGRLKGYKAFGKGMICRGKQYAENTIFKESSAEICKSGMHFCVNPFDVLDYYPLLDDDGNLVEIAKVEALDEAKTDDNEKFVTKKIRIGAKLNFNEFIKAGIDFLIKKTKIKIGEEPINDVENNRLATSEKWAQLAASSNYSQLAASGIFVQLAASGDNSKLIASGRGARLASSGNHSQLAASGCGARLAASGNWAKLAASGYGAQLAASGHGSLLTVSDNYSQIAASGNYSRLIASGYGSQLAASGDGSQLIASGNNSVVAAVGVDNKAKAAKGSWITLAEYGDWNGKYYPIECVKTEYVDDWRIKADTWYTLKNRRFVEVKNFE